MSADSRSNVIKDIRLQAPCTPQDVSNLGPGRAVSLLNTEDKRDVATSHCFREENWARRSDANNCDGAQTAFNTDYSSPSHVRMWNRHNSQFSALLTLSDYQNHWSVGSNWIVNTRVAFRLYIFPLFLCVRRGMNCEQFSQVPFDPTLMRPFNKSLRFFFRLSTYLRCIYWFLSRRGKRTALAATILD